MWLTDGFLVTFFGRWRGAVRIHVNSHSATMHGNKLAGWWEGGILNIRKLRKFGKFQIILKVVWSISYHIGSDQWQPS